MEQKDVANVVEMSAATSRGAAGNGQSREERIARLKKYQWKKGQSGNLSGRKKPNPFTEILHEVTYMQVPPLIKEKLEAVVGKLPENFTWGDAFGLAEYCAMFGELKGYDLEIARDIREAVEGKAAQKVQI